MMQRAFWTLVTLLVFASNSFAQTAGLATGEPPLDPVDLDHWSLKPLKRPALPSNKNRSWAQNSVDTFILAEMEQEELLPREPASRSALIRRLAFDLHGLPPNQADLRTFLQDSRPDAYSRLVDRMLASPRYGERWAQHWLDLARFAETDGFEHDKVRQGAWAYRDWVIDAFNADLPYDQFIKLQLAGDSLGAPGDRIATLFCLAGPDMPDINEQDLRRHDKLNELTSTVGAVLLGLQMHCAQCHDHKYDPISQADFYRLRAIFESSIPLMKRDQHVLRLEEQVSPQLGRIYHRGDVNGIGEEVPPGYPRLAVVPGEAFLCDQEQQARPQFVTWLTSDSNPLTARVIANRIWQQHFGRSLAENPSDFGVVAGGPTHPKLLDWLACELRENHWSIKHLHRQILLSATYQQSATQSDEAADYYAGFPHRRLDGESVRDAMLQISGCLDFEAGGPSVYPPLPPEMLQTLLKNQWQTSKDESDHYRRSIYIFARRNLRYPIFEVFDRPDAGATCAMRNESTTPIQSLMLLNSDLTIDCATMLAEDLLAEHQSAATSVAICEQLLNELFWRTLARPCTEREKRELHSILAEAPDFENGLIAVCVGILNCNEFVYFP